MSWTAVKSVTDKSLHRIYRKTPQSLNAPLKHSTEGLRDDSADSTNTHTPTHTRDLREFRARTSRTWSAFMFFSLISDPLYENERMNTAKWKMNSFEAHWNTSEKYVHSIELRDELNVSTTLTQKHTPVLDEEEITHQMSKLSLLNGNESEWRSSRDLSWILTISLLRKTPIISHVSPLEFNLYSFWF